MTLSQRLEYLDGWRGLSILTVLLGHFAPLPGINAGRLGVELFFVLSGRLMAEVLFVDRYPLGPFVIRRLSRVWPGMFAYVAIISAFAWTTGLFHVSWPQVLASVTFTLNYAEAVGFKADPVLGHLWSLCVEEWAYVILAFIALYSRRHCFDPTHLILGLAALAVGNGLIRTGLGGDYYEVYWRTDVRMASILMACGLYLKLREGGPISPIVPILAGMTGIVLNLQIAPNEVKYSLGTLCLATAVSTMGAAPAWVVRFLSHRVIVYTGLLSFSLYLWQQPFFSLIGPWSRPSMLACAIVAGLASYYLIERPARRYLNRRFAGAPATA